MLPVLAFVVAQQGGLYERVVPQPTGRNGYEEYVRAADILSSETGRAYAAFDGGVSSIPDGVSPEARALYRRLAKTPPLDVAREAVAKYGSVLNLVKTGNAKPISHPRGVIAPDTPLPEYPAFRYVARFLVQAASVQAADGRTDVAVETLFDAMTLGDNLSRFLIIGSLVGAQTHTIVYRAFGDLLPRLSRRDAATVQRLVAAYLARPPSILGALDTEGQMSAAGVAVFLKGDLPKGTFGNDYPANGRLNGIANMNPAARADLARQIGAELKARATGMAAVLRRPEREWPKAFAQIDVENETPGTSLSEELLHFLSPNFESFAVTNVRTRTQFRLLALHAHLIAHRWDYGRWPATVDEIDPLTGEKYDYAVAEDGTVRLASRGTPETGVIELKYKRPPGTEKPEP